MNALDAIQKICDTKLVSANLKWCLVNYAKLPFKIDNTFAKPNSINDFVDLSDLLHCENLTSYNGVGISIQASNVCAIDVDHCFKKENDLSSIDERGKDILNMFKEFAYCEFSFSGTGLRILFRLPLIDNYSETYYIKNEKNQIEYYQPSSSYRYVTLTGNVISNNDITTFDYDYYYSTLLAFLDKYMKKEQKQTFDVNAVDDGLTLEQLLKKVKYLKLKDFKFQTLWFNKAPGSGKNESELDYQLIAYLYENITQNKEKLKSIFESSDYFKSKDEKHIRKWLNQNYRYYNYVYEQIRRTHK